jgi:tetratricopeptide (TPR) repeat protein
MQQLLHSLNCKPAEGTMRRTLICGLALLAWAGAEVPVASGQGYPGGPMSGGRPGMSQPGMGNEEPSSTPTEKPDSAAKKAFAAGLKSLNRAHEFEAAAAKATDPEKKAVALDKMNDAYGKALDQFTEVLRNKGDFADAWDHVGYVHLQLGAYGESIDDYNHALAINSELPDAVEHRAEAYMAVDRLDEAKAAYMTLFNHAPPLAEQLMAVMRKWLENHRAAANGMRASVIDAFGQWLQERDGIAKQAASSAASSGAPAAATPR